MSPACLKFEQTLAWHCAPALAGIKPADLIFWEPAEADWAPLLGHYAALLARRGIHIRVLGPGPRIPLLIFRPVQLRAWLSEPSVSVMLKAAGYPADGSLETLLQHLRERLRESSFPHEIGLFLGYPPTDVAGFLAYGGRNCKLCGAWKVYGDAEAAQHRFDTFHRCRMALTRRIESGSSLAQIFPVRTGSAA